MKGCELCNGVARMYCESDEASLCWDCDEKVHSANFLVAKHSRCLLCQICQSRTTWKASGPKLGPTVSICESCFSVRRKSEIGCDPEESHTGNYQSGDDYSDSDDDDEDEEEGDEAEVNEEEEEGENQVVPWSVTPVTPPVASSSSTEDVSSRCSRGSSVLLKRMIENFSDLDSDDEAVCSSFHIGYGKLSSSDEGNSRSSNRPLKLARLGEVEDDRQNKPEVQEEARLTAAINISNRLPTGMFINRENASQALLGICRLSRRQSN